MVKILQPISGAISENYERLNAKKLVDKMPDLIQRFIMRGARCVAVSHGAERRCKWFNELVLKGQKVFFMKFWKEGRLNYLRVCVDAGT